MSLFIIAKHLLHTIVTASVLTMFVFSQAVNAELVLWNKLDSKYTVLNSEVGPDGEISGDDWDFESAQHGFGYVRKSASGNYIQFPASLIHNLNFRGSIELWINPKVSAPVPFQFGFFALVGQPASGPTAPANRGNVYLYWGDTVTGTGLYGGVRFDDALAETPSEPVQFTATVGEPFHTAISWDIDGIDGTSDTVRVYRNGTVVGSTSTAWNPNGTVLEDLFRLGQSPDAGGFDKFISDNIKVWDFAKTDFSDRFNESSGLPLGGVVTGMQPVFALCQNRVTAQTVPILLLGQEEWDCEAAGLIAEPGQSINMIIRGIDK